MRPQPSRPSIEDLEHALDVWRDRLARAPYIDSTARMIAEESECRHQIAELEAQIAKLRGRS